jgi:putative membrane protein insertion efficiency factor
MQDQTIQRRGRGVEKAFFIMNKRMLHESAKKGILFLIYLYQQSLSIFFGPCCRFVPSCSSYAALSIRHFGIMKGVWLSLKRLSRCHPFHPGGFDPVPDIDQSH